MIRQRIAYAICAAWALAKFFAWTFLAAAILTQEIWRGLADLRGWAA